MGGIGSLAAQLKKTAGVPLSNSSDNEEDSNGPKGRMFVNILKKFEFLY